MKYSTVFLIILILSGCAVKTKVITPANEEYQVVSQSDAIVSYKDKSVEIHVDNRGRTPIAETILTGTMARAVSNPVNVEND